MKEKYDEKAKRKEVEEFSKKTPSIENPKDTPLGKIRVAKSNIKATKEGDRGSKPSTLEDEEALRDAIAKVAQLEAFPPKK